MHSQGIAVRHTHHHIAKGQVTAIGRGNLYANDLAILQAHTLCVCRSGVDMALGSDHALGQLHLTGRAHQLAGAGTGNIAALPHRRGHADGAGVRQAQLHLGGLTHRAQDRHSRELALGTYHAHALVAGILAGLGQHFLHRQLIALAEQGLQICLAQMYMAGRNLNSHLIVHDNTSKKL